MCQAELMESAMLDGANSWQCFWNVTFPLLLPTIRTAALLNIVGSLKYFDLIWIMTGGGPGGASELVATYLYKQGIQGWNMAMPAPLPVSCSCSAVRLPLCTMVQPRHLGILAAGPAGQGGGRLDER